MARFRSVPVVLALTLVIAACGGTAAPAPTTAPAAPAATTAPAAPAATAAPAAPGATGDVQVDKTKLAQQLNIFSWADYFDQALLDKFEQEYGVKIQVDVFDSNEDMIAKIRPGNSGYDIAVPSDYAVDIMAKEKLLAPLDKSLLPNFANMKPTNIDLYYDKGNVYSVPFVQGMTGIGYNKQTFPTPPDSWGVLFDPAQAEKFKNQFTMLDDEREVPGAALRFIGKSLNATDADSIARITEILKAQKEFVSAYDTSSASRKIASGETVIAHMYSSNALQARLGIEGDFGGNPDIGFVMPKEGGTIWQDNLVVLATTERSYTAHVFMNFIMRPEIAAEVATFTLGISPNAKADALLPPEITALYKEGFAPDEEMYKRLEWIERNDATAVFTEVWTAVKGE
jgi:spermidine/putrescine transport system substrate-binding protein